MLRIQEIYGHAAMVRRKFARKLAKLPSKISSKNNEASFHSMKNIMIHMIYVEDWLLRSAILGRGRDYRERNFKSFRDMLAVLSYLDEVEAKTRAYLKNASEGELRRKVRLQFSPRGTVYNVSVEECLYQSVTEQLYHIGELIALLWQENIRPPSMEWFSNNPRLSDA
jgi:uncharacterized damage-inducible protein DinB